MFETIQSIGSVNFALIFISVVSGCWFVIKYRGLHRFTMGQSGDLAAKQAMHKVPTSRIGGIVVIVVFTISVILSWTNIKADLAVALAAGIFVFAAGVREDLLRDVSPKVRLIAALVSGGVALLFSGSMVTRFGISELDWLFSFTVLAALITIVWSAGCCHALNLIDGLNGLASSYAMLAALGLAEIAQTHGQSDIALTAVLLCISLSGFFVLNWPFGKIFMGDAGAYAIGHIIAWMGLVLLSRVHTISGFAILLILFWPVTDTLFVMARRKIKSRSADQPDRLHFHHVVARAFGIIFWRSRFSSHANSIATLVLLPFFLCPIALGVLFAEQSDKALIALLTLSLLFVLSYMFGMRFLVLRRFRRRSKRNCPSVPKNTDLDALPSVGSGTFIQDSQAVNVLIEADKESGD